MPYATQQNIIDRYSNETLLLIADRDNDSVVDAPVVDQAIADATAEIDTYLAAKYALPLPLIPEVLIRLCVDIVVYRLSADADLSTEERRVRYEDAIKLLVRISKGDVSLGMPEPPASNNGAVSVSGPDREFSRNKMKGVL